MNRIFEKEKTVRTKRTIEVEEIENTNLVKFLDKIEMIRDGEPTKETCTFGVTSLENIESVKNFESIKLNVFTPKAYQEESTCVVITDENYNMLMNGNIHIADAINDINKESDLNKGKLFLFNWGSHKLLDLNGEFLSIPIPISYMDSLDNERYKLNKCLVKLKLDNRILDREKIRVSSIPYYNCDEGRTKQIECRCLLSNEEYRELMENSKNSWEAKNKLLNDILGLKEFRKEDEDYED